MLSRIHMFALLFGSQLSRVLASRAACNACGDIDNTCRLAASDAADACQDICEADKTVFSRANCFLDCALALYDDWDACEAATDACEAANCANLPPQASDFECYAGAAESTFCAELPILAGIKSAVEIACSPVFQAGIAAVIAAINIAAVELPLAVPFALELDIEFASASPSRLQSRT